MQWKSTRNSITSWATNLTEHMIYTTRPTSIRTLIVSKFGSMVTSMPVGHPQVPLTV